MYTFDWNSISIWKKAITAVTLKHLDTRKPEVDLACHINWKDAGNEVTLICIVREVYMNILLRKYHGLTLSSLHSSYQIVSRTSARYK